MTALYEVILTDSPLAQNLTPEYRYQEKEVQEAPEESKDKDLQKEIAFLKISYKEPGNTSSVEVQHPVLAKNVKQSLEAASSDFLFATAVSYFAHLLRDSKYVGDYNFEDVAKLAQESRGEDPLGYKQELIELMKNASLASGMHRHQGVVAPVAE